MRLRSTCLAAALALAALPADADPIRVGGRVLDAARAPLAGAGVTLVPAVDPLRAADPAAPDPSSAPRAVSDESGRFALLAPRPGVWKVRIEAPGFLAIEALLRPLIDPLELEEAVLRSDVGLTVRVRDAAGAPAAGAVVGADPAASLPPWRGEFWRAERRTATTGIEGAVRLPYSAGEVLDLVAFADGHLLAETESHRGTAAELRLTRGTAATFEVVDERGAPLAGVRALVGPQLARAGITDERGRVRVAVDARRPTPAAFVAPDGRALRTRLLLPSDPRAARIRIPARLSTAGRIVDFESRGAVPGGVVWDGRDEAISAASDAAGGFALSAPAGTRLELRAGAPGYLAGGVLEFQLVDDGRPGPVLGLRPAASVEGDVVDADGRPVPDADVRVEARRPSGGDRVVFELGRSVEGPRARSDARGRFRLAAVDPERMWSVAVRAPGFAPAALPLVGLKPRRARTGLRITLSRGRSLVGRVVDADGEPIADATVRLTRTAAEQGPWRMAVGAGRAEAVGETAADRAGRFALAGLAPGRYDVEVRRRGYAPRSLPALEVGEADEPFDVGSIVLAPGQTLEGFARDRAGAPVEGVEIRVRDAGDEPALVVRRAGDLAEPDAVTDAGGFFAVHDLAEAQRYDVSARRGGWVEGRAGGVELPRTDPLLLALEPASDVAGRVTDEKGEPIADARVALRRSETVEIGARVMRTIMVQDASTDHDGRFVFEDQEPGSISLGASAAGFQDGKLDNVAVPRGEDVTGLEIPLSAGAVVEGRVLAPDGRPALGATVARIGEGTEPRMPIGPGRVGVDGNGYYRIDGLAPGPVSVEASHDDYPRTVRDLEVKAGRNRLDLTFAGGAEVSGRVRDTEGRAVPEALVRLAPAGRAWGGPEARSGADGSFRISGATDGEWTLLASAEGFAPLVEGVPVRVEGGAPVGGIEVALSRGGRLAGRIRGLDPQHFPRVVVEARGRGPGSFQHGTVDYEGDFRVDHLPAGDYEVAARVEGTGRQASGRATVPADGEARLDLEFGAGVALSGTALLGDAPIGGATVLAEGLAVDDSAWTSTDAAGRFRLEGLDPGSYRVDLREFSAGLAHSETIELATNREVTLRLPVTSVSGRIVDAADRAPLSGVTVTLEALGDSTSRRAIPRSANTDLSGRFTLASVPDGTWQLGAAKKGYAAQSESVVVSGERGVEDVRLELEATEGLSLAVRLPSGAAPSEVGVAVLDAAGIAIDHGNYATGEQGSVRLSSVPPGRWTLVVAAAGAGTSSVSVAVPGPRLSLALPPPTALRVEVPALAEAGAIASARLVDAEGQPFRGLGWNAAPRQEWTLVAGRIDFVTLPPGTWSVEVRSADGRTWRGSRSTAPGEVAVLQLD